MNRITHLVDIPLTNELRTAAQNLIGSWQNIQCHFRRDDQDESAYVEVVVHLEFLSPTACLEAKSMFDRIQCADERYISLRINQCLGICDHYCIYQNPPNLTVRVSKWWKDFKRILQTGAESDKVQELQGLIKKLTSNLSEMRQVTEALREAATDLVVNCESVYRSVTNLERLESEILDLDRRFRLQMLGILFPPTASRGKSRISPSKKLSGAKVGDREQMVNQLRIVLHKAGKKSPNAFLSLMKILGGEYPFPQTKPAPADTHLNIPLRVFLGGQLFAFAGVVCRNDNEVLEVIPASDAHIRLAVSFRNLFRTGGLDSYDFLETDDLDEESRNLLRRMFRVFNAFLEALIPPDQRKVAGSVAASGTASVKVPKSAMDELSGQTLTDLERSNIVSVGVPGNVPPDSQGMPEIASPRKVESRPEQSVLHNGNSVSSCMASEFSEKISGSAGCNYTIQIAESENGHLSLHVTGNSAAEKKKGTGSWEILNVLKRDLLTLATFVTKDEPLRVNTSVFSDRYNANSETAPSALFARVKNRIELEYRGVRITLEESHIYIVKGLQFEDVPIPRIMSYLQANPAPRRPNRRKKSQPQKT